MNLISAFPSLCITIGGAIAIVALAINPSNDRFDKALSASALFVTAGGTAFQRKTEETQNVTVERSDETNIEK